MADEQKTPEELAAIDKTKRDEAIKVLQDQHAKDIKNCYEEISVILSKYGCAMSIEQQIVVKKTQ